MSVLAAACGGGGDDSAQPAQETGVAITAPEQASQAAATALASRVGQGITAAGGSLQVGEPCPPEDSPGAAEAQTITLVTPDLFNLGVVGLGNLVFDDPAHIIHSYVSAINGFGGVNGHCFGFSGYVYGFTDPVGDFGRICSEVPQEEPLVMLVIGSDTPIVDCITLAAQVPTIGLYAQSPQATFAAAGELLRVDHGAHEFLLENGMEAAASAGVLTSDDSVALIHKSVPTEAGGTATDEAGSSRTFGGDLHDPDAVGVATFDAVSQRLGLQVAGYHGVTTDFSGTAVLVFDQQFRDLGGDVFDPDDASFEEAVTAMPPDIAGLLAAIRAHFMATAAEMRDAGVTAVVAAGDWADVRNLMRAAELAEWYPKWIINDAHYALLVLTDSPKAQGLNLFQVSSRRAADDPIDGLDRGCLNLRNTEGVAGHFSHRYHTDAWSLMTAVCDYLDVIFAAISRADGPLTRESFLAALGDTDYEAAHGQTLRFADGDYFGSDSFRVLAADQNCVLNDWGCMRALTDWLEPVAVGGGA